MKLGWQWAAGCFLLASLVWGHAALDVAAQTSTPPRLRGLFLGDNGHHQPALRYRQLAPVLAARGIDLVYTDRVESLEPRTLGEYDVLVVYANHAEIASDQEQALLDFVQQGKGFVPLHCASYCFLNSPRYIALCGAQFQRHGTGVFRTELAVPEHPVMRGFRGFESWDETYSHHKHNEVARTVLEYRVDEQGREPWTWVRTEGKGRVFYTAWGHDERTWGNPGFQNLVERGIRWAAGGDVSVVPPFTDRPEMTLPRKDLKPFTYLDAVVPFYPAGKQWGTVDEPLKKMQAPLAPSESLKHYITPVEFELQLFASEPDIQGKPLAINWDERGRLWVAESVDYPNELRGEGEGRDRVRICEDTDGDGRADKFTVFADKLSIPTSLVFSRGGLIVHQAPHTLFLRDTDGDDVADERRVLFTGWSTSDTHAGPSNLRYGLDNWIYGQVGYAGFEGEIAGERHSFRTGFYRFRPGAAKNGGADVSTLEFLRNTNNNSWGVGISEEGLLFGSTANGNPSVYLPIPNRFYEAVRGWSSSVLGSIADSNRFYPVTDKVRQVDHHGGFTAAAGHALYTARAYPPEYWNRTAFVCEPTGHLAATFTLTPQGADFRARYRWNLAASDDEWAAPTMAEVGPDGNVWLVDWYNFIVQHNPTPAGYETGKGNAYETELRDKKHARVYRLLYKGEGGTAGKPRRSLAGATPSELVDALRDSNMFWRLHAQRLLVERGVTEVASALIALLKDPSLDGAGLNPGAMHALWTLHGLELLDESHPEALDAAIAALRHPAPGVRRSAVLVLPRTDIGLNALLDAKLLRDADAQVQLATLLTLAEMPPSTVAAAALVDYAVADGARDDFWLLDAFTAAAGRQGRDWLVAVASAGDRLEKRGDILARLTITAEHFARQAPAEQVPELVGRLAGASPPVSSAVIAGLERGWPKDVRVELGPDAEEALRKLVANVAGGARARLVSLARRWGSRELEAYAREIVTRLVSETRDEQKRDDERLAAARQLIEFAPSDLETVQQLLATLGPRATPQLAAGILDIAGLSESDGVGQAIIERLGEVTPATRPVAVRVLLRRPTWSLALIAALESQQVSWNDLSLDQKQALAAHPDKMLAERARKLLARGGSLPNPDRQKVLDELQPLVLRAGSAVRGKEVFKKQCAKCHVHGTEGNKVGPDLTGMAVHPKKELLIHILDPSRSVEGNYRVYTVVTDSGLVINGLLASETKTTLELFDAEGKRQTVLRENVDELRASPKSLMPEGFEKQVSVDELTDLLEFLTQRGRYLPIPLDKVATVVTTKGMFYAEDGDVERLIFSDWTPKIFRDVPFVLVDPRGDRVPNAVMLHGPQGVLPPRMPKSVTLPCNAPASAVHFLSGVSGWGHPASPAGSETMIVRLRYSDGTSEDHVWKNGEQFADYIRRVDVPGSEFAYALRGQQIRYLAVKPSRGDVIESIELIKGDDPTAPIVMAVTIETREASPAQDTPAQR